MPILCAAVGCCGPSLCAAVGCCGFTVSAVGCCGPLLCAAVGCCGPVLWSHVQVTFLAKRSVCRITPPAIFEIHKGAPEIADLTGL